MKKIGLFFVSFIIIFAFSSVNQNVVYAATKAHVLSVKTVTSSTPTTLTKPKTIVQKKANTKSKIVVKQKSKVVKKKMVKPKHSSKLLTAPLLTPETAPHN